jgi:hypothetical protein
LKNPASFKDGDALTSERVIVRFKPLSLLTPTPVIEQLTFLETEIHYRYELLDGTNIGTLAKQLDRYSEVDPNPLKFVVENVRCVNANVKFSTNLIPKAKMDMNLLTVNIDNLSEDKAIGTSQATAIFLRGIIHETLTLNGLLNPIVKQLRKESGDELENAVLEDLEEEKKRAN